MPREVAELLQRMRSAYGSGQRAPDFAGRDLERERIRLEEEAEGAKLVLLDFWASWCPPCRDEYPYLRRLHQKYADQGLKVVGINLDTDRRKAMQAAQTAGLAYRHVFDGKGWRSAVAVQYQVNSIPQTFLLDGDLKLIAAGLRGAALEQVVPHLLASDGTTMLASLDADSGGTAAGGGTAVVEDAFKSAFEEMARSMAGAMTGGAPNSGFETSEADFVARDLDGETIRLADEAADSEYVLLDFWASWCGPCRAEFPYLRRLNADYRERGLKIIGVNLDNSRRDAERAVESAHLDYPHVFDGKGWKNAVAVQYQVRAIPQTVLLDKDLNVVAVGLRGRALEQRIDKLLRSGLESSLASRRAGGSAEPAGTLALASSIGDSEIAALVETIRRGDERDRAGAVLKIGQLGEAASDAAGFLIETLRGDPSDFVRSRAASALGEIGADAEEAVPALIATLEDDEYATVRNAAVKALEAFGHRAKDAIPALTAAMVDPNLKVRRSAADALKAVQGDAAE